MKITHLFLIIIVGILHPGAARAEKMPVLVVDGRNNHDWRTTTDAVRTTLERTGIFEVSVTTAPEERVPNAPREPKNGDPDFAAAKARHAEIVKAAKPALDAEWAKWSPDFSKFAAVVLDYNGANWPEPMKKSFIEYVRGGGGVFLVHAANNAFGDWPEFNEMIGLGWRKAGFGTALKIDPATGNAVDGRTDAASGHGSKHPFVVASRKPEHPVMRGLPGEWMHGSDELYHHMRGPARGVAILASAFSEEKERGSGMHEPVLWETAFGKGRVLTCSLGHCWVGDVKFDSLECVGFQTLLARGVEFVASGKVTLDVPGDFPTKEKQSLTEPHTVQWKVGGSALVHGVAAPDWKSKKAANEMAVLTPEEERATFVLPPGHVAELVAAEPLIEEPVLAVWDGNGAMFVAEMRSYMQDEAGTGTKTMRNGRIKRLTSSKGDGEMDKATVFVDGLNLPRMILPLADGIAVVETDSTSVWLYRDTKGTGVADEKTLLFAGKNGDGTRSVEHQDSGLDWNLDNWIYVSYGRERYRFTDGVWKAQATRGIWTQWGITHDDEGRVFFSDNSSPAMGFILARQYWSLIDRVKENGARGDEPITLGLSWDPAFLMAKNICARDDRGAVLKPGDKKVFTSLCGQSVFRGTAMPPEVRGDYFVCDPTIHVVRRAKIENRNGRLMFSNAHGDDEFMLSPDILFRPVSTATGPDGCLTVVDMYRGIIQDAPWLNPESRKWIKSSGLGAVTNHGRIWRIRQIDHTPSASPRMNGETTAELLRHFENPNGWWRDTAQKLIVLRKDRESIAPNLADMVRFSQNALARLHALWTLEGMGKADAPLLIAAMKDGDARLRAAAVRISEPLLAKNNAAILDAIEALAKTDRDAEVAKQIVLSLAYCTDARNAEKVVAISDALIARHVAHEGVFLAACVVFWKHPTPYLHRIKSGEALAAIKDPIERATVAARWTKGFAQWERALKFPKDMPQERRKLIQGGEDLFFANCVSCHGPDGKGVTLPGGNNAIAPALAGSERVKGPPAGLVPVLINGLLGPIEGKSYEGQMMVPAAALGIVRDDRLAEVLSFIRYAWGNEAASVTKDEVKDLRKKHEKRTTPWSDDELKATAK